ncbi:hypothetical protein [Aeromicrobium sp. Leaf350]|uniref:hypothetical protein n=1 Tax=Aeromicrobium sp. Leaf350 TaxID=2876565 RepID=UPI001E3C66E1|nr:hypothetical protein [Aeromicrobium sp. Leaf350]
MTRRGIVSVALLSVLLAGCGGDPDDPDPGPSENTETDLPADDSLVGLVRTLPELPDADTLTITFGDVEAIADANGVDTPTDGDLPSLLDWSLSGGTEGVPIVLPGVLQEVNLNRHQELEDELGVSLWSTTRYAEVAAPPYRVAVLDGDHGESELTEAIGEPDDGIWALGGEELEVDLQDRTAARPLGEALRLATTENGVAIAATEELARGAADADGSLVDDDLDQVLTALDDIDPVAGIAVRTVLGGAGPSTNGAAYAVDGDEVVARLVLGYPGDEEAESAVADVEAYFTDDTSLSGQPWSDLLTVGDVSADGSVVVVDLTFPGEQRPVLLVQMLLGNVQDLPQARA